jgi:siroheme decarboxylase
MVNELTEMETRVLAAVQNGFPTDTRTPFASVAQRIGMDTEELLAVLRAWKAQGRIRRVGAMVNHFRLGMGEGAMVVWQVEPERVEEVGQLMAGFKAVSHAYQRPARANWPYNLYTMVHGSDARDVERTVCRMQESCGVAHYRVLATEKELKKSPPKYVVDGRDVGPEG